MVTLVGLIAKHGILIVEFANQLQEQGADKLEAVLEAAALRLRPILMTTGAMVLGSMPLAIATGAGAEARNQIGWVIVGGMAIGTLFTLFVVPVMYLLIGRDHYAIAAEAGAHRRDGTADGALTAPTPGSQATKNPAALPGFFVCGRLALMRGAACRLLGLGGLPGDLFRRLRPGGGGFELAPWRSGRWLRWSSACGRDVLAGGDRALDVLAGDLQALRQHGLERPASRASATSPKKAKVGVGARLRARPAAGRRPGWRCRGRGG